VLRAAFGPLFCCEKVAEKRGKGRHWRGNGMADGGRRSAGRGKKAAAGGMMPPGGGEGPRAVTGGGGRQGMAARFAGRWVVAGMVTG